MGKITQFIQTKAWRPLAMAGTLLVVSAGSAFTMTSVAQAQEAASAPPSGHHPHGPRGPGGPGLLPFGGPHLDHVLDSVKATDAQRTQIKALAKAAEADLKPLHQTERSLHQQTLALFAQPTIDAATAENLRQQGLVNHDAVSKRILKLVIDVGNVLTPAQRAELVAKLEKRQEAWKQGAASRPKP